jgi:quercetin dioxygenase-like cupin family protein
MGGARPGLHGAGHPRLVALGRPARSLALTEFVNPAGFASPLHVHHDEHEAIYILEFTAEVHCADEAFRVAPGSFVLLPKGLPHWHQVSPYAPMRSLVMTTGHFECYAAACGEPAQARHLPPLAIPDIARAAAVGDRFHIEALGPAPRNTAAVGVATTPQGFTRRSHEDLAAYSVTVAGATLRTVHGLHTYQATQAFWKRTIQPGEHDRSTPKGKQPTRRPSPSPPLRTAPMTSAD